MPWDAAARDRIQDDEQLPHAGGERDLGRFARGPQPEIEGADDGIASTGDERGHVERRAHRAAAAVDQPNATSMRCS